MMDHYLKEQKIERKEQRKGGRTNLKSQEGKEREKKRGTGESEWVVAKGHNSDIVGTKSSSQGNRMCVSI